MFILFSTLENVATHSVYYQSEQDERITHPEYYHRRSSMIRTLIIDFPLS
jgi:hypothetical protein